MGKKVRRFACAFAGAFAVAAVIVLLERNKSGETYTAARLLCDGAFVSGILYVSFGAFVFVSGNGGFDTFCYAAKRFAWRFRKNIAEEERRLSYFDYVRQRESRPHPPCAHLFIVGLVMVLLACVMLPFCAAPSAGV